MFEDMTDEEIEQLAEDEEQAQEWKEMRERDRRLNEMDVEELLREEFPEQFVALEQSSRNSDYYWLYLDYQTKASEIGTNVNSLDEAVDTIIDWHDLQYTIKSHTPYRMDTSSYRQKQYDGKEVLVATLKPAEDEF